jgi:hypothetical protein
VIIRYPGTLLAAVLIVLGLRTGNAGAQAQTAAEEYRLKAAFVFQFPQFVEWPAPAWTGRDSLEICVSQPNAFGTALKELIEGESVKGRPLVIRQVGQAASLESCHLLFIAAAHDGSQDHLLQRAASLPILTIGEAPRFLDRGGIINLRLVDRRVRFEINVEAADRAGLRLSSQLLRLAKDVRSGRT